MACSAAKIFSVIGIAAFAWGPAWAAPQPSPSPSPAAARARVLIIGDSITEGYGLSKAASFPAVLQELLKKHGYSQTDVIDAGVAGATSASGPSSLNWQLRHGMPKAMILELGANDGLRGLSPQEMKKNLRATIEIAKKSGIPVLLVGMKAPPNYGKDYVNAFDSVFPALAREEKIAWMPFLLAGVAGEPSLNQEDGIHPNERGAKRVAKNVFKYLEPLL
jgi:acyl-CoA thioesterase-1